MGAAEAASSIACVVLDPVPALLPPAVRLIHLERFGDTARLVASAFVEFNAGIIEAVAGRCAAVKPQSACYERLRQCWLVGAAADNRCCASSGVPVILDAKGGDIGSTAEHYAQTFFGGAESLGGAPLPNLGGDWATVNSYLGRVGAMASGSSPQV